MSQELCYQQTCRLTIIEGPDGGGKTTFARAFAEATGAHYVHFGPMLGMHDQLARIYVEAMQPALMGWKDVVFDRSWLSEYPYGIAFRGADRLGVIATRMLERLAYRCATVVVLCAPPWPLVRRNFLKRRAKEYLEDTTQLHHVYRLYMEQKTSLPIMRYDYHNAPIPMPADLDLLRSNSHRVDIRSAGNLSAQIALVGEDFADHTNFDALYQWPFASFGAAGCSRWFTQMLIKGHIDEEHLYWVNADQPEYWTTLHHYKHVFALGDSAMRSLTQVGINHRHMRHPQSHKRFSYREKYPLINEIQKVLRGLS